MHRAPPRYHGLIDGTLRRRPAFHAVKNLMTLFHGGQAAPPPRALDFRLDGATDRIRHQLFQKDERTFLLTAYQDVDSYDRSAKRDIEVAPVPVGLTMTQPAAKLEVYAPTLDLQARQSAANANTLTIPVADHVSVVKITL